MSYVVLARADVPAACVELRDYRFPSPSEMWELDDAPIFSVVMPRAEGTRGEVSFDCGGSHSFPVGRGLLRPAGIGMRSRGDGGKVEILRCRFDPVLFADVTGLSEWDARQLSRCAAIASATIMDLAEKLRREVIFADTCSDLAIDALARLLLVEIGRMLSRPARRTRGEGGLAPWQLARIDEALHGAAGHWPTTEELAMLCRISRPHLSRIFSGSTGVSLAEYAERVRMRRAEDLLRGTALPVNRIAQTLGFSTASAFSVAFRRVTGQTPRSVRQAAIPTGMEVPA